MRYEGAADFGVGARGTVLFNVYNTGNPGPSNNTPSFDQAGPYRGAAAAEQAVAGADVKWSACDVRRALNVNLRLQLARAGSTPLQGTIGGASSKLVIQLGTRPCQVRDGGVPPSMRGGA